MKFPPILPTLALATLLAGPPSARAVEGVPDPAQAAPQCPPPLLVDSADLGLGATVVYTRIPNTAEVHDLQYLESVGHVMLSLGAWPASYADIEPLSRAVLPEGADLVVILPGYPPTREAAGAWNLLHRPVRIVMVVDSPPVDREMVFEMNSIRGLERVIADLPRPARTGFERLQRPLSFRVIVP